MPVSLEQATVAKKAFKKKYIDCPGGLPVACSVRKVIACDAKTPPEEQDDYCVAVVIRKSLTHKQEAVTLHEDAIDGVRIVIVPHPSASKRTIAPPRGIEPPRKKQEGV